MNVFVARMISACLWWCSYSCRCWGCTDLALAGQSVQNRGKHLPKQAIQLRHNSGRKRARSKFRGGYGISSRGHDLSSVADPDKNRIRILEGQNIDQNRQKIIPKFSERRLFCLLKKCDMAIFFLYMIWSSIKNLCINYQKFVIRSDSSRIRFKIVWIRNAGFIITKLYNASFWN